MTNSCVIHATLEFRLAGTKGWRLSCSSAWRRGVMEEEEEAEGGGRLIRHGARAQSPPLDIMCLAATRMCMRVLALLCRPSKSIRFLSLYLSLSITGFSLPELRYLLWSIVLAATRDESGFAANLRTRPRLIRDRDDVREKNWREIYARVALVVVSPLD